MGHRLRPIGLGAIVIAVFAMAVGLSRPMDVGLVKADTLQANGSLKWYRGNLHTHSNWSDGDDFLEMIAVWYRDHGYDFVAFTDHNILANKDRWVEIDKLKGGRPTYEKLKASFSNDWVEERIRDDKQEIRTKRFDEVFAKLCEKGKFLLIQGEEISDSFHARPIHLNANNIVMPLSPLGGGSTTETIQNNVNALLAERERYKKPMMIHLNHPNLSGAITAEDLAPVRGENFFEVYNGHPLANNLGDDIHPSTERIWDIINTKRLTEYDLPLLFGLACDDAHSYHDIPSRESEPGRGWVMVLSKALTPESLILDMEAGRFYASTGVTLDNVTTSHSDLKIEVRPDADATYTIEFIGTRKGFDPKSQPVLDRHGRRRHITRKYSDDIGTILKTETGDSATYTFSGDELYVRARITSSRLHPNPSSIGEFERAWTQPIQP